MQSGPHVDRGGVFVRAALFLPSRFSRFLSNCLALVPEHETFLDSGLNRARKMFDACNRFGGRSASTLLLALVAGFLVKVLHVLR